MPLVALALHRLVARPTWRGALALGAAGAFQAATSIYYGVIGAVGAAVSLVSLIVATGGRRTATVLARVAVAAVVGAVLVAPFVWPYLQVQRREGFTRNLFEAARHAATPASYVSAPRSQRRLRPHRLAAHRSRRRARAVPRLRRHRAGHLRSDRRAPAGQRSARGGGDRDAGRRASCCRSARTASARSTPRCTPTCSASRRSAPRRASPCSSRSGWPRSRRSRRARSPTARAAAGSGSACWRCSRSSTTRARSPGRRPRRRRRRCPAWLARQPGPGRRRLPADGRRHREHAVHARGARPSPADRQRLQRPAAAVLRRRRRRAVDVSERRGVLDAARPRRPIHRDADGRSTRRRGRSSSASRSARPTASTLRLRAGLVARGGGAPRRAGRAGAAAARARRRSRPASASSTR